jgi:hypothetical protein
LMNWLPMEKLVGKFGKIKPKLERATMNDWIQIFWKK